MRLAPYACILLMLLMISCGTKQNADHVQLTPEERQWLNENPDKLVLYFNTEFPPIEYISKSNRFTGLGADVIKLVEQNLGVHFKQRPCPDWEEHLAALKSGACAIAPTIVDTPEREDYTLFTEPYATVPVVIITPTLNHQPYTEHDLSGLRVGVVENFASEQYMRDEALLHHFTVVPVPDVQAGLRQTAAGQLDAFVENLAVASYYVDQLDIKNLHVAGATSYTFPFCIGVSREYPLLYSAVYKALQAIPPSQLEQKQRAWISLRVRHALDPEVLKRLEAGLALVLLLALILSAVVVFLRRRLRLSIANLRASERRYGELVENVNSLIVRLDRNGRISYINEYAFRFFGYAAEEMLGRDAGELLLPGMEIANFDLHGEIDRLEHEPSAGIVRELVNVCRDGRQVWVSWTAKPMYDVSGRLVEILCVGIDMTQRRLMEEELRSTSEELEYYFASALDLFCISNRAGRFVKVNQEWERVLGYSREFLQQVPFMDLIHPEDRETTREAIRELEDNNLPGTFTNRFRCQDGTYRYIEWRSTPHGDLVFAAARDVTERFQAQTELQELHQQAITFNEELNSLNEELTAQNEELVATNEELHAVNDELLMAQSELRDSEGRLSVMFQRSPSWQVLLNLDTGEHVDVNEEWCRVFGFTREEAMGKSPVDLGIYPAATFELLMTDAQLHSSVKNVETTGLTRSGEIRVQLVSREVLHIQGVPHLLSMGMDITERKQIEEALRERERLFSSVLAASTAGIGILKGREFLTVNNEMCRITGYAEAEIVGRITEFLYETGEEFHRIGSETYAQMEREGLGVTETRYRRKDGTLIDVLIGIRPLDAANPAAGIVASFMDITERKRMEGALRERESLFRSVLAASTAGIAILKDRKFETVNNAMCRIMGYPEEELLGQSSYFLYADPAEYERIGRETYVQMAHEGFGVSESRFRRKDGTFIDVIIGLNPIDRENPAAGICASVMDITERKRIEEALQDSERFFRSVLAASPVGITLVKDRTILTTNYAMCRITGYAEEDFIGQPTLMMYASEEEYERVGRETYVQMAQEGLGITETLFRRKDGEIINILIGLSPFDLDNPAAGICASIMDITERKHMEEALKERESFFRSVLAASPAGICFLSERTFLTVNAAMCRITGYSESEMLGLTPQFLYAEEAEFERVGWEAYTQLDRDGLGVTETRFLRKDGEIIDVILYLSPLQADDPAAGICACVLDITERKQAEQALRRSEAFLANTFDYSPMSQWVSDEHGLLIKINHANLDMLKLREDEVLGKYNIFGDNLVEEQGYMPLVHQVFEQGKKANFMLRWDSRSLQSAGFDQFVDLYLDVTISPLFDSGGKVSNVIVQLQDITKRFEAEAALRESERNYREIYNATNEAIIIQDAETAEVIDANERMLDMFGYTHEEVLACTIEGLSQGEGQFTAEEAVRRVRAASTEGPQIFEWLGKHKSGELLWIEVSLRRTEIGGQGRVLAVIRDISERKKAESMLHLIYSSLNRTHDGVTWILEDGRIHHVNDTVCQMLGYTREELLGMHICDIDPGFMPGDWSAHVDDLTSVGSITFESSHRTKSGENIPIEVTSNYIEYEGQRGSFALVRYIADRKRQEAALKEKAALLEAQANATIDGILVVDENRKRLLTNQRIAELFEVPPHVLEGDDDTPLLNHVVGMAKDPQGFVAKVKYLYENVHETSQDELEFINGLVVDRYTSPVIGQDGKYYGRIWTFRDITERKRAEVEKTHLQTQLYQAQKMESVGRLAGGVAHDFNNMLGVILGHAELALDHPGLPEAINDSMLEIQKAAERSANLTRQLLAFARKQAIAPVALNLNEAVVGMLKMLQRLIGEDIKLNWVPNSEPQLIRIDPSQVDQILANLCANARDAIVGTGKVTIETGSAWFDEEFCSLHANYRPGEYVMLAVSDDGSGMDDVTLEHLFEPFYTTKDLGKGTGLGLATVYGIVQQNDGFITIYSELGQGTCFKIYLPRLSSGAEQQTVRVPQASLARGSETILLVEDELAILNMTAKMLQRQGYTVLSANSPGEAISIAREHAGQIDLLVTDVIMPEMNGRDLAQHLLGIYPEMKRVFMSGYTANVIANHGMLEEGIHFVQKPYTTKDLATKIRTALDES
jgi:two-component system, cell cycle sensor histidine kinase and response regulator CckA